MLNFIPGRADRSFGWLYVMIVCSSVIVFISKWWMDVVFCRCVWMKWWIYVVFCDGVSISVCDDCVLDGYILMMFVVCCVSC